MPFNKVFKNNFCNKVKNKYDTIKNDLLRYYSFTMQRVFAIATDNNILPIVQTGVSIADAKRNTLIFIFVMCLFLLGLVLVGYWTQKSKKSEVKKILIPLLVIISASFLSIPAKAFCPVCTIAIGAGLSFTKVLGIDDTISSIWIGGVLLSSSLWLINWLDSKNIRFFLKRKIIYILMYGFVLVPFISSGTIGALHNQLWGIDKIVLGMILGTAVFALGMIINSKMLQGHNNKPYFPFQKVVMPMGMLILLSLIFFFIVY